MHTPSIEQRGEAPSQLIAEGGRGSSTRGAHAVVGPASPLDAPELPLLLDVPPLDEAPPEEDEEEEED